MLMSHFYLVIVDTTIKNLLTPTATSSKNSKNHWRSLIISFGLHRRAIENQMVANSHPIWKTARLAKSTYSKVLIELEIGEDMKLINYTATCKVMKSTDATLLSWVLWNTDVFYQGRFITMKSYQINTAIRETWTRNHLRIFEQIDKTLLMKPISRHHWEFTWDLIQSNKEVE